MPLFWCVVPACRLLCIMYVCMFGHTYSKSVDQPGKVASPARGQLKRENEYFAVCVRAWEFGPARRVRQSRPASACSSPYSGGVWCLLTDFLPSSAAASIYLFKPPYVIGSVPSLSFHVIADRWHSLPPRVRPHRVNKPQGSSKRVLRWQVTMDQFICVFLCDFLPFILDIKLVGRTSYAPRSFPHPLLV